jgi:hypothetical protein
MIQRTFYGHIITKRILKSSYLENRCNKSPNYKRKSKYFLIPFWPLTKFKRSCIWFPTHPLHKFGREKEKLVSTLNIKVWGGRLCHFCDPTVWHNFLAHDHTLIIVTKICDEHNFFNITERKEKDVYLKGLPRALTQWAGAWPFHSTYKATNECIYYLFLCSSAAHKKPCTEYSELLTYA